MASALFIPGLTVAAAFIAFAMLTARKHPPQRPTPRFGDLSTVLRIVIVVLGAIGLVCGVFLRQSLHR